MITDSVLTSTELVGSSSSSTRRVLQKCARQRDALPLAAGEAHTAFADDRLVPLRQRDDEIVRIGGASGILHILLGGGRFRIQDVVRHAGGKQDRVLVDDRELVTQVPQHDVTQIDSVQQDLAGRRVVEARQQRQQGRLTGAGRPGDADAGAGADTQR